MSARIIKFPPQRAVLVTEGEGAWLVLAPGRHRHGWLHGNLSDARKDAAWLSKNLGIGVFETTTTSS